MRDDVILNVNKTALSEPSRLMSGTVSPEKIIHLLALNVSNFGINVSADIMKENFVTRSSCNMVGSQRSTATLEERCIYRDDP